MSKEYTEYLKNHKNAVIKAYQWISTYIPEFTDAKAAHNIVSHDLSKYAPDEYTPYDNYFYGEKSSTATIAFNRAWLMHIHRNPHHWQYWVLIGDDAKEGTICIEMPHECIIEMICDWWSFSWIKGDLFEIFAWYKNNKSHIKLHSNTRWIVEEILGRMHKILIEQNLDRKLKQM